jgi:hypothetical protein
MACRTSGVVAIAQTASVNAKSYALAMHGSSQKTPKAAVFMGYSLLAQLGSGVVHLQKYD